MNAIAISSTILIALLWGIALLNLTHKKTLFYAITFLPLITLIYLIPFPLNTIQMALLGIIITERVCWGITLYEIGSQDKVVMFYLVLIFPLVGWLTYRMVKLA